MSISLWVGRYRQRGSVRPDPSPGRSSRIEPERERIIRLLGDRPDWSGPLGSDSWVEQN